MDYSSHFTTNTVWPTMNELRHWVTQVGYGLCMVITTRSSKSGKKILLQCERAGHYRAGKKKVEGVKEVEEKIKEQQKESQAMEKKFELPERRYKNQKKRVERNNKEVTRLKRELEGNEVELENDSDMIKRLRAEKWELQEKNSALEQEVKDLKQILDQEGLVVEEVEEVDETTMIEG